MTKHGLVYFGAVLLLGLGLIVYSKKITEYILPETTQAGRSEPVGVAKTAIMGGSLQKRNDKAIRLKKGELTIHHGDNIKVPRGQTVELSNHGYILNMFGPADWTIEKWNPDYAGSPIYITVTVGDYELKKTGNSGLVYIVKGGRIFAPEMQPPSEGPRTIEVQTQTIDEESGTDAPTAAADSAGAEIPGDIENETPSQTLARPEKKLPSALTAGKMPGKILEASTITNEEIAGTLGDKAHLFRRCQINSLRDNEPTTGTMLISMTIEPSGKVTGIRVLQNEMQNKSLAECVQTVISRTLFREFEGLPVSVSYPVEFR